MPNVPRGMSKDLRDLAKAATKAGWTITLNGRKHFIWRSPEGHSFTTPFSPSDWRTRRHVRAKLRRAGLDNRGAPRSVKRSSQRGYADMAQAVLTVLRCEQGQEYTVSQLRQATRIPEVDSAILRQLHLDGYVSRVRRDDQELWVLR